MDSSFQEDTMFILPSIRGMPILEMLNSRRYLQRLLKQTTINITQVQSKAHSIPILTAKTNTSQQQQVKSTSHRGQHHLELNKSV